VIDTAAEAQPTCSVKNEIGFSYDFQNIVTP